MIIINKIWIILHYKRKLHNFFFKEITELSTLIRGCLTYVILFLDQLNGSLGSPHRSGWCPGRDRDTLGHITKRGPKHPSSMLVQGAAALIIQADRLEGALGDWVQKIKAS